MSPASRSSASTPKCSAIESTGSGAQVHQVEVIAAQLAQVLLDLAAQLVRPWPQSSHSPDGSRPGPTLVAMTRSSGYGASAVLISSLAERSGEK